MLLRRQKKPSVKIGIMIRSSLAVVNHKNTDLNVLYLLAFRSSLLVQTPVALKAPIDVLIREGIEIRIRIC